MSRCKKVIPNTFIACGEGGNYCSDVCAVLGAYSTGAAVAFGLMGMAQAINDTDRDRRVETAMAKVYTRNEHFFKALAPHDTRDPNNPGFMLCGCCRHP